MAIAATAQITITSLDDGRLFILKASPETYIMSRRSTIDGTITIVPQVSGYSSVSIVYGAPSRGSITGNDWTIPAGTSDSSISVTATLNDSVTYTLTVNGVESVDSKPIYWGPSLPQIPEGQQALTGDYCLDGFVPRRCPSDGTAPSAANWPEVTVNDSNYSEIMANVQADAFKSIQPDSVLGAQFGYITHLIAKYVTAELISSFQYIIKNGGYIKSSNYDEGSDGYPASGFLLDSADGIGRLFGVKIKGLDAISATIRGNIIHDYFRTVDPTDPGSAVTFDGKTHWKAEDIAAQIGSISGIEANKVLPMGGTFNSKSIAGIIYNNTTSSASTIACASGAIEATTGTVTKTYACLYSGTYTVYVSPMNGSLVIMGGSSTLYMWGGYSIKVGSTVVKQVASTYTEGTPSNTTSSWTGTVNTGDVITITATGRSYASGYGTISTGSAGSWSITLSRNVASRTMNFLMSDSSMASLEFSKFNSAALSIASGPNGAVSIASSSYIKYALPTAFLAGIASLSDGAMAPASGSMVISVGGSSKIVEYVKRISSSSMTVFFSDQSSVSFSAESLAINASNAYPASGTYTLLGDSGGIKVGDTLPLATDVHKLGSLDKRFKELYCKNAIVDSMSASSAALTSATIASATINGGTVKGAVFN